MTLVSLRAWRRSRIRVAVIEHAVRQEKKIDSSAARTDISWPRNEFAFHVTIKIKKWLLVAHRAELGRRMRKSRHYRESGIRGRERP